MWQSSHTGMVDCPPLLRGTKWWSLKEATSRPHNGQMLLSKLFPNKRSASGLLTMNEGTLLFVVSDLFDSQALKYSRSEIARHFVI